MNHFMNTIIILDDDNKVIGTSIGKVAPQIINGNETNSNLINKETGSQDDFIFANDI
ncbi:30054_t:CDS:2 [Gigaspora margarita]|uniref:30054_t:CDS:1 n=1 Tax=Gigaspora margarita TaxID=4874 RepID=A0ABN7WPF3_GIGMA|nr:30054_t:CDS:2 [Gigaspora margarita]